MMSIEFLRSEMKRYGALISAPISELTVFTGPQVSGAPYINECDGVYIYRVSERGMIFEERRTSDPDEVLYWLMKVVVAEMSYDYELRNRVHGKDSRRIIFQHEIDLFSKLKPEWAERHRQEIDEVLSRYPFSD